MSTLKKDKEKVLDEVWTEERVRSFLDLSPPTGVNADFHILYNAYKSMRVDNFSDFLGFYNEAGRDFSSKSEDDETLLELMQQHKKSTDFITEIKKYL